jgi:hypothetical protein
MKQTAVEWLYEKILLTPLDIREINKCLEQAKEMEKEQIMNAWYDGWIEVGDNSEHYYNETFKSE